LLRSFYCGKPVTSLCSSRIQFDFYCAILRSSFLSDTENNKPSTVLDKKSNANPQQGTSKSPNSNTVTNSIKARFAPHTYIEVYKEEDYFPDLKGSNSSSVDSTKVQPNTNSFPSVKDYIEKSTTLSDKQKQKIGNNLKAINEALSGESSTSNLALAVSSKVKGLDQSEVKEIVDAYLNAEFEGGRHQNRVGKVDC
jgi:hypothetical protein